MKKIFLATFMMVAFTATMSAQEANQMPKPDLTGETLEEPVNIESLKAQAGDNIGKDGQAQWYVRMDYADFDFELPAGLIVDKGASMTAKSQDGTFGLSMSTQEMRGANQKEAFEICRRMARELCQNPKVQKESFGKCNGAVGTGVVDGTNFMLMVLPYNNKQITAVMFWRPEHQNWADKFRETLKR